MAFSSCQDDKHFPTDDRQGKNRKCLYKLGWVKILALFYIAEIFLDTFCMAGKKYLSEGKTLELT